MHIDGTFVPLGPRTILIVRPSLASSYIHLSHLYPLCSPRTLPTKAYYHMVIGLRVSNTFAPRILS
jgi:hypothetical protein